MLRRGKGKKKATDTKSQTECGKTGIMSKPRKWVFTQAKRIAVC